MQDQAQNERLKKMWKLDEVDQTTLTPSEVEYYNAHLEEIQRYYHRNASHWLSRSKITKNSLLRKILEEYLKSHDYIYQLTTGAYKKNNVSINIIETSKLRMSIHVQSCPRYEGVIDSLETFLKLLYLIGI